MALLALTPHINRVTRYSCGILLALGLSLLVACGGGGGGGNPSPPTLTFTWTNAPVNTPPNTTVYSGAKVDLMATFTYGKATISWTDESDKPQSRPVTTSGSTESFTPTRTTTYTLSSDNTNTAPIRITVTVIPTTATLTLTPAKSSIDKGAETSLTPTFSCTGGPITQSVINYDNKDNAVSSGTAIVVKPTQNTTYTLKVTCQGSIFEATTAISVYDGPPKFTLGGNLATGRSNHVAVLLPNGLVLVAGGTTGTATLKSSELYDPVKNTWTATGDMVTARTGHSALLLINNKVLVTGGFDGTTALSTAEIYDPATGKWLATTGPMAFSHNYHTSTPLADGKVLIAGGVLGPSNNVDATSTEVYSPILGTFVTGPNLPEPRQGHTATVLSNGKVLFVGNSNGSPTATRLLTYTAPSTFAWADLATPPTTGSLTNGRWNHSATLLGSGKVLVAGGFGTNPKSAELYDPATNAWTSAGSMASARAMHTSTLLRNGKVLIIGGYDGINALTTVEIYDPSIADPTKGWSTATQKVLNTARASHTSTLLGNDNVLAVGTYLQAGGTASAATEIWAP